ncbi:MAG: hypothetical protein HOV81_30400 [Kofleriaceae bacterium]|nr:hypothetical protein [Kofleriaceae bacterium]
MVGDFTGGGNVWREPCGAVDVEVGCAASTSARPSAVMLGIGTPAIDGDFLRGGRSASGGGANALAGSGSGA